MATSAEADGPLYSQPILIKCGKPGELRMKYLLPWGVIMCDECLAKKEAK